MCDFFENLQRYLFYLDCLFFYFTRDEIIDYLRTCYKMYEKGVHMIRGSVENILLKLQNEGVLIPIS